jgi:hypothetical protein
MPKLATLARPLGAALALSLLPAAAAAAGCAPRDVIVERLEGQFSEALNGAGLRDGQSVFEVWASPDSGTWTILVTAADGTSCVVAHGTGWRPGDPAAMVAGKPA